MHWITQFRMNYRRKDGKIGITEEELAKMICTPFTGCNRKLIEILEAGGITHPDIADRIAHVTGATPEQRDSIVHKKHRGKRRKKKKREKLCPGNMTDMPGWAEKFGAMGVVQIGKDGREMCRHLSITRAAKTLGCTTLSIGRRCRRELWDKSDEFDHFGFTFRYAAEWDDMSPEEKERDIRGAGISGEEETC